MSDRRSGTLVRAGAVHEPAASLHMALEEHEAATAAEAAATAAEATAVGPQGSAGSRRRRAARGERMAVYLPPTLVEELRVRCARERRSMSDAVSEAVGLWALSGTGT